jgi:transcriptional regulator GlxA family with amidase domain
MNKIAKKHLVVAVAYNHLGIFELGCVTEIFALKRPELGVVWYDFAVCSIESGTLHASAGMHFEAPYTLDILDRADTIVIPGWRNPDESHRKPCSKNYALLMRVVPGYARFVPVPLSWLGPACSTEKERPPIGE